MTQCRIVSETSFSLMNSSSRDVTLLLSGALTLAFPVVLPKTGDVGITHVFSSVVNRQSPPLQVI